MSLAVIEDCSCPRDQNVTYPEE